MIRSLSLLATLLAFSFSPQSPSGDVILKKVDENMFSENKISVSRMVIHGRRDTRTVESKSWQRGTSESYTEFLAPAREKGTKMLKLKDMLWDYSPSTDRTIMISGSLLRQSVMGSDLSYEDMMEDPHLPNIYSAKVMSEDTLFGRDCWILDLTAKKEILRIITVVCGSIKTGMCFCEENLYAESGKLLKTMDVREVMRVQGRWLAKSVLYKDVLKDGEGTEFLVDSIVLDADIPDYLFSKAALKR